MVKGIYSLLIYMFRYVGFFTSHSLLCFPRSTLPHISHRSQFNIDGNLEKALLEVNLFTVRCYIQHWYVTQVPQAAPGSDQSFVKALVKYKEVNSAVAEKALDKVGRHYLWYLSEEMVSLAFFDDEVPLETKRLMVKSLSVNIKQ